MSVTIPANPAKLDAILKGIHEHGGKTTLGQDWAYLQRVQHEMPAWAKPVFDKYKTQPHVLDGIKQGVR